MRHFIAPLIAAAAFVVLSTAAPARADFGDQLAKLRTHDMADGPARLPDGGLTRSGARVE